MSWELGIGSGTIGLVVGWILHRTHFCTMGAISDLLLFGSKTRLKTWLLAVGLAMLMTTVLRLTGTINIQNSVYLAPSLGWLALVLGGWLFGFGMVLAGGCASRNLVRLGGGSLKALFVILTMSTVAAATSFGWLRWMPETLDVVRTSELHQEGLGVIEILGPVAGGAFASVLSLVLIAYCLMDKGLRCSASNLSVAIVLGTAVPLGWIVTGSALVQPQPDSVPTSLGYLLPAGELLRIVTSPFGLVLKFAVLAWIGTFLGAVASAVWQANFRVETFSNHEDMVRHLKGGALMGVGGVLCLGCTIGQGVSGISTLAPASILAMVAIFFGSRQGIRYLETGRFLRFLRRAR